MFTSVYYVYHCLLVHDNIVYPYLLVFTYVYLFTYVYSCLAMFLTVQSCMFTHV